MARSPNQLKNLKPFKKGQSGNPRGGQLHNPAIRAMKKLTIESLREVIEVALTGNVSDLKAMVENPKTPAIQVGFATAIMKAIKDGDPTVLERFAERLVGKIPEIININQNSKVDATLEVIQDKVNAMVDKARSDL